MNLFWLMFFGLPCLFLAFTAALTDDDWVLSGILAIPTAFALVSCIFAGFL